MNRRQAAMGAASQAPVEPPPVEPPPPAEDGGDDKYAKLKELKELLDSGILTEEEFAAEKAKILGD